MKDLNSLLEFVKENGISVKDGFEWIGNISIEDRKDTIYKWIKLNTINNTAIITGTLHGKPEVFMFNYCI